MSIKIVKTGEETEIQAAMAYLDRTYGIPAGHVAGIMVDAQVNEPMKITVTVYVRSEATEYAVPAGSADEVMEFGATGRVRIDDSFGDRGPSPAWGE